MRITNPKFVENEDSDDNGYLSQKQKCKEYQKETSDKQLSLPDVEILQKAATVIFRLIQGKSLLEQVKVLISGTRNSNGVSQSYNLFKLDILLDSNGALQVGGGLSRSKLIQLFCQRQLTLQRP